MEPQRTLPSHVPSYVHGASPRPLIGETIGRHLDRCAATWGERDALVSCQQGIARQASHTDPARAQRRFDMAQGIGRWRFRRFEFDGPA